ncbi:hypothetical protein BO70DRAFT_428872 [Aspergillus heteromorphus CBS 117.55]|uniref:Uncharacterized protein n=1 Tax=Aspergillus heteromorphus CBS 117.55 TaxID=1448321 RepID=A0A317WF30_9EURO|nr:uncharacterized protein BO70DRAFT_428872 [Aspergillus heteromorphus CBS 117.55]PWY83608.1 hypothetical protein BO70DRAFT_428872 [Aspergillus heteromorphus CBS 117.55]
MVLNDTPPPLPPRPTPTLNPVDIDIDINITTKTPLTTTTTTTPILIHNQIPSTFPRPSAILPKPIVIPQTSHTLHGTCYRPFLRAYPSSPSSSLPTTTTNNALPIPPTDFLTFIDALNEVWLAHPYFQVASTTGNLLGFVPLLEFQLLALGVQTAAECGAFQLSRMRTQAYMRLANEQLFAPRGLRAQVLTTRGMMREVGVPGEVLALPDLRKEEVFGDGEGDTQGSTTSSTTSTVEIGGGGGGHDPQMRRMEAIKEYVCPVVVEGRKKKNVSGTGAGEDGNWLKRAAEKQEMWFTERQNTGLVGRRSKAVRAIGEAEAAENELLVKMDEVEMAMDEVRERARERLRGPLGESLQGRGIVQDDLQKDLKKLDKKMGRLVRERAKRVTRRMQQGERRIQRVEKRENKIAQRVMWVVVTGDDGTRGGGGGGFRNDLYEED